jgi:transposase
MMRQKHKAGEKLFIDYAGQTAPVVDPETGEIWQAEIFVAVLGASNYMLRLRSAQALRRSAPVTESA